MRALVSATISTAALRHNLEAIRRHASHSRVMAVVKANAYGHGLAAVAQALGQADAFAVARIEEGIVLRNAGITQPVVLLEGVFDREQLMAAAKARFELVVHSADQIDLLREAPGDALFPVWLKLDTGMNRLGFRPGEFESALSALRRMVCVRQPVRLCTHMANADTPEHPGTGQQLAVFDRVCAGLEGEQSTANSAALFAFRESQRDWVRPGIALFGVSPFADRVGTELGLLPVMTLRTRIIAVKTLEAGESVGYGSQWTTRRRTVLAIAAIGYGDGYPRNVISSTQVLVAGRRAPLAGRVSMDMLGVDVTDVPQARVGTEVVLWGEGLPVERIASCAGTVPYELLCGISQRVAVSVV